MYPPQYVPPQPTQPVTMGIGTGFKFGLGNALATLALVVPIVAVLAMVGYAVSAPTIHARQTAALPMVSMTAK